MSKKDKANWWCQATLYKYHEDIEPYREGGREAEFHKRFKPYETIKMKGNLLLNVGCDIMWDLITGASGDHFDNGNATIGVGSDNTGAGAGQTDLIDGTPTYKGMEAGFPTSATQKATFKSSFGAGDANEAWEEWTVKRTVCLNRKVESLGTKAGGTWTLEVDITLS